MVAHADKEPSTVFGRWLLRHRLALNLTISKLAARVAALTGQDLNQGRITDWQFGWRVPKPAQLAALRQILGEEPPTPNKAG